MLVKNKLFQCLIYLCDVNDYQKRLYFGIDRNNKGAWITIDGEEYHRPRKLQYIY